ncbi:MAG: TonB family protein [Candidatus Sulfotelmatobacter sp.]
MSDVPAPASVEETPREQPDLRLLVALPSRPRVFFGNLWDLFRARETAPRDLQSAPAPFWPDVFVAPGLPWRRFFESGAYHGIAFVFIWAVSGFLALQPQALPRTAPIHDEVIYYTPEEYLPPLDTRRPDAAPPQKADPESSTQPIISLRPEPDNRSQTIVTPPDIKLKQDVALPNVVAWSDRPKMPIAPAPVVLASSILRLAPAVEARVVAPAPDLARAEEHRDLPGMQTSVIAPPPDVRAAPEKTLKTLQTAVIAPPPQMEAAPDRRPGDINIGRGMVIAPAPRLMLDAQRATAGRNSGARSLSPQVIAPPPTLRKSSPAASGAGGGRMIALNLHPAVGAPPIPPAGNRRGSFAATPEGHHGASGAPGSAAGESVGMDGHSTGNERENSGLPAGLYVGKTSKPTPTSPVAGDPAGKTATADLVNPNLIASLRAPRVSSTGRALHPANETRLTEEEREVFHDRRFYSLTLNMPNLNSAGGSWIIRFAELKQNSPAAISSGSTASDLSAPAAIRKVDPAYPLELMRQNLGGTVILFAVIHADGTVGGVRVLRSVDERLDQFAAIALSQWKFAPAEKNGSPVDVEATFQIPFRPGRARSDF